jgi:hypothetical protein
VVELTRRVLEGNLANGVAVVRPPGHHATCGCSMGFCVFNNVAVAARAAMRGHWGGARRAMILDWDVHHGNGTQKIFETDSSVLYVSIHRYDDGEFFPGGTRGHYANVGSGTGRGYTVNIPWDCPGGRDGVPGDADYLLAFEQIVEPLCKEFRPDIVLVSAGFDAAVGDPLGGCQVTPGGFYEMTRRLQRLPSAQGRLVIALEGGYNLKSTARSITACTSALLGDACPTFDDVPRRGRTSNKGTGTGRSPKTLKATEPGDTIVDIDGSTGPLSTANSTATESVSVHVDEPIQTARPHFRDRIEEVKAALSVHWPSLCDEPSQSLIRPPSLSAPGVAPGQQIRLHCGNTYRCISPSVAKLARTGPPGMKLVHEWSLCVRLADEDDAASVELSKRVARVEFRLDASFNSAVIVVRRPPFAVARRSWTAGTVGVTVVFKPSAATSLLSEGAEPLGRLAAEAWGNNVRDGSGYGMRCRPSGLALRPAELSHVLSFAEGGASAIYTIRIEEEAPTAKPTSGLSLGVAAAQSDSTDNDNWSLMAPQERRRAALRRRREENARRRDIEDGKACEESAVGSLFYGR